MPLINWNVSQSDEIIRCARRWIKRLDERGRRQVPSPPSARNHKKRHSVNQERSHEEKLRAKRSKMKATDNLIERQRRKGIMRDYFAGELPDLSAL